MCGCREHLNFCTAGYNVQFEVLIKLTRENIKGYLSVLGRWRQQASWKH